MGSLKSFFDGLRDDFVRSNWDNRDLNEFQEQLGIFFWEELINLYKRLEYSNKEIINNINIYVETKDMKLVKDLPENTDRLLTKYALACLGEEKVKELMEELK